MNKRLLCALLCGFLLLPCVPAPNARAEGLTLTDGYLGSPYVVNPNIENRLHLRAEPSRSAASLGRYYAGVRVEALSNDGTWSRVTMGPTEGGANGYMLNEFLAYTGPVDSLVSAIAVMEVAAADGSGATPMRAEPAGKAPVLNTFLDGTRVERLGDAGDWCHVRVGYAMGYVRARDLQLTGDTSGILDGVPTPGFAVVALPPQDATDDDWGVHAYANAVDAPEPYYFADYLHGDTFAVTAAFGDWVQTDGSFVRAQALRVYWADLLTVPSTVPGRGNGQYTVGETLPAGLYTYHVPDGVTGLLHITGTQGAAFSRLYEPTGPAAYTVYLPKGASVRIQNGGVLEPTQRPARLAQQNGPLLSGTGRFLVGYEQAAQACTFRGDPEGGGGYVVLSSPAADEGYPVPERRIVLEPGQEEMVRLSPGQFVEYVRCQLETYRDTADSIEGNG